jgi:hypothetical protein|tara:strand:+ start:572 stop:898 length:327 start_codon:yes stop_codon:yes gene_type:complete
MADLAGRMLAQIVIKKYVENKKIKKVLGGTKMNKTEIQNRTLESSCCNCGIPATDGIFNNPENKILYPNIADTAWMCRDCNDSIIKGYEKSRDEWCNEMNQIRYNHGI